MANRLHDTNAEKIEIITVGEPVTPNEAYILAEQDNFQSQWRELALVGVLQVEQKKGADHRVDGKILFRNDPKASKAEQIIIQVKGGKTGVKDVRDLRGVLDREPGEGRDGCPDFPATAPARHGGRCRGCRPLVEAQDHSGANSLHHRHLRPVVPARYPPPSTLDRIH